MQKMNPISNFFFEILWKYHKLVTLSIFKMLDRDGHDDDSIAL